MTTTTTTTTATTTSTTTITSTPSSPLQDASNKSTIAWQSDLEALFHRAKDRFPDVVWSLLTEEDGEPIGEEVYGHKGISSHSSLISPSHISLFLLPPHQPFPCPSRSHSPLNRPWHLYLFGFQPSYMLVLPQASRHDTFLFAQLPYYLPAPWTYILHPAFPPSPLSLFLLVQMSPPYPAPLHPFAPHLLLHKVKMA